MTTFQVHTFGCKVNTYDTGLLQKRLTQAGYLQASSAPKIHILNTCAVTQEATREAVREIRRLKARDPLATVVVTGCAAQVDTDAFSNLPGADLVVANSHKGQLEDILKRYFRGELESRVFKSNIFHKDDLEAGGGVESTHTRAFVKIQDGCNSFCAFCIIPFARGKSRSIGVADLVARIRELSSQGIQEVVLTGVHIGDYQDGESRLEDLLSAILLQTQIPRLRLSSLEPVEVTSQLLDLYSDPRLCRHFHMSIQSACSKTLREMKRQYTADEVEASLKQIHQRVPGAFVGMDVIAGFSGESDQDFAETYQRLADLPWTRLHVFPYSERHGTRAARRDDQVPMNLRGIRARRLRELSLERYLGQAQLQVGTHKQVLLLKNAKGERQGLGRDYWPVRLSADEFHPSTPEVNVKITQFVPGTGSGRGSEGQLQGCVI